MMPVEAFATVNKMFEQQKVCLIPSDALDCLIFRVKDQIVARVLDPFKGEGERRGRVSGTQVVYGIDPSN